MVMEEERWREMLNFTAPPRRVFGWGNQRFPRSSRVKSAAESSRGVRLKRKIDRFPDQRRRRVGIGSPEMGSGTAAEDGDEDDENGIAAMRVKVICDLQTAACRMKDAIFTESRFRAPSSVLPPPPPEHPPWNLRARRASYKILAGISSSSANSRTAAVHPTDTTPVDRSNRNPNEKRPRFSVSLSKTEIEEDFIAIMGHRRPRRPVKRPKSVQKSLDDLFPGLYLREITAEMYRVDEPGTTTSNKQKRKKKKA